MRFTTSALISIVCACGSPTPSVSAPHASADVAEYAALAYVPDRPTYLVTAHTVREAQRSAAETFDSLGMLVGASSRDAGQALEGVLGMDPLTEAGLAKLGIDPAGSIAVFAESASPTIVVQLAAPQAAQTFFAKIRNRMATRSVVVEGAEVVSAPFLDGADVSWAFDKHWLWVHVAAKGSDPGAEWFTHSHHATGSAWTKGFGWAKRVREKLVTKTGVLGFVDSHALLGLARTAAPELAACIDRFSPVGLAGFALEGDGHRFAGRLELELGPAAQRVSAALLPPPPGFTAVAAKAPLAVQWNLDLAAVASFLEPCVRAAGGTTQTLTQPLTQYGLRTLRVAVQTLDPPDRSGTGVVAADLSNKAFLADLLDQVPRRSFFESDRTFGAFAGHHLSIPFVAKVDYVLDAGHGYAAMGEGLMAQLVKGTIASAPPVVQLDLVPSGLSQSAWTFAIAAVTNEWFASQASRAMQAWQDGHLRVVIDHDALVIDVAGNRR